MNFLRKNKKRNTLLATRQLVQSHVNGKRYRKIYCKSAAQHNAHSIDSANERNVIEKNQEILVALPTLFPRNIEVECVRRFNRRRGGDDDLKKREKSVALLWHCSTHTRDRSSCVFHLGKLFGGMRMSEIESKVE